MFYKIIDDNRFVPYKMYFQVTPEAGSMFSDAEERILFHCEVADAPSEIYSMLTNADIKLGTAKISGKKHLLKWHVLFPEQDRRVRKDAYNSLIKHIQVLRIPEPHCNNIRLTALLPA